MDKLEELKWIYATLRRKDGVYLLADVVDAGKEYSVSDVHKWGMEEACSGTYEKIRDLIEVRIHEAVRDERLDKLMAESILKTFYYKPYADAKERQGGDVDLDDVVLTRLKEMLAWCKKQKA